MKLIIFLASAGGLKPFIRIVKDLDGKTDTSIVFAAHRSENPDQSVISYFDGLTNHKAMVVEDKVALTDKKLFIAERKINLTFFEDTDHDKICIDPVKTGETKFNPDFNELLKSAAPIIKDDLLVVTLSGMMDDGVEGLLEVFKYGGLSIVQSPEDSDFESQPLNAILRNHPNSVLPADQIADEILKFGF